jgi:hypothetical protein
LSTHLDLGVMQSLLIWPKRPHRNVEKSVDETIKISEDVVEPPDSPQPIISASAGPETVSQPAYTENEDADEWRDIDDECKTEDGYVDAEETSVTTDFDNVDRSRETLLDDLLKNNSPVFAENSQSSRAEVYICTKVWSMHCIFVSLSPPKLEVLLA